MFSFVSFMSLIKNLFIFILVFFYYKFKCCFYIVNAFQLEGMILLNNLLVFTSV